MMCNFWDTLYIVKVILLIFIMAPELFCRQNHAPLGHVNRFHPVAKCGENNYTKNGNGLEWRDQPTII